MLPAVNAVLVGSRDVSAGSTDTVEFLNLENCPGDEAESPEPINALNSRMKPKLMVRILLLGTRRQDRR